MLGFLDKPRRLARRSERGHVAKIGSKRAKTLAGRRVCLVDDVMTSGATLALSTEAAFAAGAAQVCVLTLARVEKAP